MNSGCPLSRLGVTSEGGTWVVCLPVEPDEVVQVEEVPLVAEVVSDCWTTHRVMQKVATTSAALKLPSYPLSLPEACYYI